MAQATAGLSVDAPLPAFGIQGHRKTALRRERHFTGSLPLPTQLLGIEVSMSGTTRDTLGVLVSAVASGSPAEQAGLRERERIAEVNGMSLRVSREDVGSKDAEDLVFRRLARELEALKPGDAVSMRVYGSSRPRTVTIRIPIEEPSTRARDDGSGVMDIIASLRETQTRLHGIVSDETGAVRDSLAQIELEAEPRARPAPEAAIVVPKGQAASRSIRRST